MKEISAKMRRKRKFLLVLPVIVIPFLTLAFKALGGGNGDEVNEVAKMEGINTKLPDVKVMETDAIDKLSYYNKAASDSVKMNKLIKDDPYYQKLSFDPYPEEEDPLPVLRKDGVGKYSDANEERVYAKLRQLNEALEEKPITQKGSLLPSEQAPAVSNADVARLESLMKQLDSREPDKDLEDISNVMDKILDVQYPERMQSKMKVEQVHDNNFQKVSTRSIEDTVVNGFYGLDNDDSMASYNTIEAVVHEGKVLTNGSVIQFRLLQDVFIGTNKVPAGTFVSGVVALNGERLHVVIESIRSGSSIYSVKMEVFDMDGLPGINVPGAITRDVAKQSADKNLQSMELNTLDPSLKMQAAAAGIHTAKSLLSKKVKTVKVMVKAGYRVLLKTR